MNNFKHIFLLCAVLLITGCAKYVTDKNIINGITIEPTKYLELTVSFAAPLAGDATYYVVLSTTTNMTTIEKTKMPKAYFVSPIELITDWASVRAVYDIGDTSEDITPLYDNYFKSWGQIYTYDAANKLRLYNGPFVSTANQGKYTELRPNYLLAAGSGQLKMRLPIPADTFWFQVLAVDQDRILKDHLPTKVQVTYINNNNPVAWPTALDDSSGLDIISYQIRTYEY